MSADLALKVFHGLSDFANLIPAWTRLLERIEDYEFYHHPSWHEAIQKCLLPDQISYVLVEEDREPRAIIPLTNIRSKGIPQSGHIIRNPQHDHIVLSDWIVSPCMTVQWFSSLIPLMVKSLGVDHWAKFSLSSFPQTSLVVQLHERLHNSSHQHLPPFLTTIIRSQFSAWFACDQADQPIGSKLRRNLRRLKSQAETLGPVELEVVEDEAELPDAFEKFLCIEASGWKGSSGTGSAIAHNPSLVNFYRRMLSGRFSGIKGKINLLWFGEKAVAAQYILQTPACVSVLKIGYNEDFKKFSPGSILLKELIDTSLHCKEIKRVSLVTCPSWAERWHPNKQAVYTCNIYNNTTAGKALKRLDGLKSIARSTYRELKER